MPVFAPPYRPSEARNPLAVRQQQQSRKRKRDLDASSDEDDHPSQLQGASTSRPINTTSHPVRKTDPYHVAGYAREESLPPPPFPHAPVRDTKIKSRPIEDELADLTPPLYIASNTTPDDRSASFRRRHLDNLTTILHRCMLKSDWARAQRAWSLLIRTEIAGRGIDVRRNGRWPIGAELLMRKFSKSVQGPPESSQSEQSDAGSGGGESAEDIEHEEPHDDFSDQGFKLARDYYERLIIQFPYTRSTVHSLNATAIYPALFDVWIYGVQEQSQRARKALESATVDSDTDGSLLDLEEDSRTSRMLRIRQHELEQALPIADRMDELLISPPYDSNQDLKRLRRMVAAWVTQLYSHVSHAGDEPIDFYRAEQERAKAQE